MLENAYQARLIKKLKRMFPGCFVLKNDTDYYQGIPDLLVLYQTKWAMLEVKKSRSSSNQPNQEYYIDLFGEMSFSAFIYPENEEEILDALQRAFSVRRKARVS